MKNKHLKLAFAFITLVMLFTIPQISNAVTFGNYTYTVNDDGTATITHFDTYAMGEFVIPSSIDGYNVTSIGDLAFRGCTGLTSITIPESVIRIGNRAFYNCTGLTNITIGEGITSIGTRAFENCSGLERINWNARSMEDFKSSNHIFSYAGQSGNGIDVIFGNAVESIPAYAFCPYDGVSYSPKIKSITIGKNVTNIGNYAFYNCMELEKINWNAMSVADFNSFNRIFSYAGQSGNGINVVFGNAVENIPAYIFCPYNDSEHSPKITNIVIEENVANIGVCAFRHCTALERITWNARSVESFELNNNVFAYAGQSGDGIEVVFGDEVKEIPNYAFTPYNDSSYSPKIKTITIGKSVTNIGDGAFYNCTELEKINWNAMSVEDLSSSNYVFSYAGQSANGIDVVFGDEVEKIPANTFYPYAGAYSPSLYSPKIKSITIGVNVTSIGRNAFFYCKELEEIKWNARIMGDFESSNYIFSYAGLSGNGIKVIFGDSVESIPAYAFCSHTNDRSPKITSVIFGESVRNIGDYAFFGCNELESIVWNAKTVADFDSSNFIFGYSGLSGDGIEVVFGDCVESIPAYIFCPNTMSEYLPKISSVLLGKNVANIGSFAFCNCDGLTNITIPGSVTHIGGGAFNDCDSLTNIIIPSNMTSIEDYTFDSCDSLSDVVIQSGVMHIGSGAFRYCKALTSIMIPESVTDIGDYAFDGCVSLTNIEIPNSVTDIGGYAFSGCEGLTNITIPRGVTNISTGAFVNCNGLININVDSNNTNYSSEYGVLYNKPKTKIIIYPVGKSVSSYVIPSSVTSICDGAFGGCASLTNIEMPNSVTDIGDFAFSGCEGLTNITIPSSVTSIGDCAFRGCASLTSIEIPNGVTSIERGTFSSCTGLTSIIIPNNVTNIDEDAFAYCINLDNIIIPNAVTDIGVCAFYECVSLTNIEIPANVTSIGDEAFGACTNLESITISNSMTRVGDNIFFDCVNVKKVVASEEIIVKNFKNNRIITDVTITSGSKKLDNRMFEGFSALERISLPDTVITIGDYAFKDCSSLIEITVPSSVNQMGKNVFYNCLSLEEVTFPFVGTKRGNSGTEEATLEYMFGGDDIGGMLLASLHRIPSVLSKVTITDETIIPINAFANCGNLTDVIIDGDTSVIMDQAFYGHANPWNITIKSKTVRFANAEMFDPADMPTIYGYAGSTTETYAKEYDLMFVPLTDDSYQLGVKVSLVNGKIVVKASADKVITNQHLHIALFNDDAELVDYIIVPMDEAFSDVNVVFKDECNSSLAKVFLWDGYDSITPVAEAKSVTIPR